MVEQKAFRGKMWAAFGVEQFRARRCGNVSLLKKKRGPDEFLADAGEEKPDGTDGDWQQETP